MRAFLLLSGGTSGNCARQDASRRVSITKTRPPASGKVSENMPRTTNTSFLQRKGKALEIELTPHPMDSFKKLLPRPAPRTSSKFTWSRTYILTTHALL